METFPRCQSEADLKLSILEQSTLSDNASASDAISNTIAVAIEADRLGYTRIWLSEHHNLNILQGSSPEILLAAIGAQTERIRIGSGGVMLPTYSPYHVAENFRVLEALYPGRIDCGIGRASGGDSFSRSLLSSDTGLGTNFDQRLNQLKRHFHDECKRALAMPTVKTVPPIWLLSGGGHANSGILAAEKGLGLALALFINPFATPEAVKQYRDHFKPSSEFSEPRVVVALNVVCAADESKLQELKKTSDLFRLMRDSGNYLLNVPGPNTIDKVRMDGRDEKYLQKISKREVVGTPDAVNEQIRQRAEEFGADEIMLTMMYYSLSDKIDTLRLLARALLD
jgi:luciferase family oxidoreductase group 1